MVRADLEDRKTVTRRLLKPYRKRPIVNLAEAEPTLGYSGRHSDADSWGYEFLDDGAPASLSACPELCPYGKPGDRLWVREAWRVPVSLDDLSGKQIAEKCLAAGYRTPWCPIQYEADGARNSEKDWREFGPHPSTTMPGRYRHARFMPRWASRITLEVTGVRVERLQDIRPAQILAEGVRIPATPEGQALIDISTKYGPAAFLNRLNGNSTDDLLHAHWAALWVAINGIDSWNANPWVWAVEFKNADTQAQAKAA